MDGELNRIKKIYGENFAKLCRSLFPTILEEEGKLLSILQAKFAPTRSLYEDLIKDGKVFEFKYYIYNLAGVQPTKIVDIKEKPDRLMAKAGYTLFRCKTKKDIDRFKKFYSYEEQLCTFTDPNRHQTHHVFFAVKKGADKLKRSDFVHPKREDEYGTSVISIQFNKLDNDVSIKNRYNHTVENPDSTFYNDLENIIPGLTSSFAKHYGLVSVVDYSRYNYFQLENYVMGDDGKNYRVNQKTGDMCFCENNVVVTDEDVVEYDKARYELVDCYLIDRSQKTIKSLIEGDSFVDEFENIEKIDVEKAEHGGKKIVVVYDGGKQAFITTNRTNAIVSYENEHITEIKDDFLKRNTQLKGIKLPNVKTVGDSFCRYARDIKQLEISKLKSAGSNFLAKNQALKSLDFPELEKVGDNFVLENENIDAVSFPKLKTIGSKFLGKNKALKSIELPSAELIENEFLFQNKSITEVLLPNVIEVQNGFMAHNTSIQEISFPKLKYISSNFLRFGKNVRAVYLPEADSVGIDFLREGVNVETLVMPKVQSFANGALADNKKLMELDFPMLRSVGSEFLVFNEGLKKIHVPNVSYIGQNFLQRNRGLTEISLPKLSFIDYGFLQSNNAIVKLELPNVKDKRYLSQYLENVLEQSSEKENG